VGEELEQLNLEYLQTPKLFLKSNFAKETNPGISFAPRTPHDPFPPILSFFSPNGKVTNFNYCYSCSQHGQQSSVAEDERVLLTSGLSTKNCIQEFRLGSGIRQIPGV
jgi:hypothetical protein